MKKYAVIKTGGKQYLVSSGQTIKVEKIEGKKAAKIEFDQVLLIVNDKKVLVGQPFIKGAKVTAEVKEQIKDKKIKIFKFKAKSRYRLTKGHRQLKTVVEIKKIVKGKA